MNPLLSQSSYSSEDTEGTQSIHSSTQIEEHIHRGFQLAYEERYEEARKEFQMVINLDEESPSGYFFQAGLLGLFMNDFMTLEPEEEFLQYINEAEIRAKKQIEMAGISENNDFQSFENDSSRQALAWSYFYLGGSYGYRAFHHHQKKSYLNALSDVMKAAESLKKAIEIDSTLYDAYMGVGGYHYFINELWGVIPFVGADSEQGIQEVKLAMEKGRYSRIAAKDGLVLILLREEEYTSALKLTLDLIGEYPRNRTFTWTLAKVFKEMGDWERALQTYEKLQEFIQEGQPDNLYNLLSCKVEIARVYIQLNRERESIAICRQILDQIKEANPHSKKWGKGFPFPRDLRKETKKFLKQARMKRD
jgi:tetratricopeptide (TPR) repeat protein